MQPKIQKWVADSAEEEASDNMDRLLMMNDLINNVVNRYEAFKKGDRSATAEIDPAFAPGTATSKAKAQAAQVSLIDFDFDDAPSPAPSGSNIPWSTTATNASSSRASTPGLAGAAIQLPGSRPGSAQPASPYDGMAAFGHQQSQVKGAPPVPQKDAFEDLLL